MSFNPVTSSTGLNNTIYDAQGNIENLAIYPALNDPNFVEKWDWVKLNPEERQAFLSLLSNPGHDGKNFDHFLDMAPSFGHLLAYIMILKEQIPQGTDNQDIRMFLKSFMDRVCKRLICRAVQYADSETNSSDITQYDAQNCFLEIISDFHCCYEKNSWPDDANELFVVIRFPNCEQDFKVYRLAYLAIHLIDLIQDDIDQILAASLETLKDSILILMDQITTDDTPFITKLSSNDIGTMIKLLNRGFSMDQTFLDSSNDLEVLLNPLVIKCFIMFSLVPCIEIFFWKLSDPELIFDLKTLCLVISNVQQYWSLLGIREKQDLKNIIESNIKKYTLADAFEIDCELYYEENCSYKVFIKRTDFKIQGEKALIIMDQILHQLPPSDTQYFIAEGALTPELLQALPHKADLVLIAESFQFQPWAIKVDLMRHFTECKKFRIPIVSITNEILNAFQEFNFETIEWFELLTSVKLDDLNPEQLQLYEKFMGMIPPEKGTIEFPKNRSDKLPLSRLLEIVLSYPKLSFAILDHWLISNTLCVPETEQELPIFIRLFTQCLASQLLSNRLIMIVKGENHQKNILFLLSFIIKTPDLKNSIRRCPDFALALLDRAYGGEAWLELLEYLLRRQILSAEGLKQRVYWWGPSISTPIFNRLISKSKANDPQTSQFAQHLVPIATELSTFVLKMFPFEDLKTIFSLLLNEGWKPSYASSLYGTLPLHLAMLKPIKNRMPFTHSYALPWFATICLTMPAMNEEEQKDFLLIFKHIHTEQKNPLPKIGADYAMLLQKNPIILEGFLEEYPKIHFLENAFSIGLAIVQAVFTDAPSEPNLFKWKKQSCVLLLDSLRLKPIEILPEGDFTGALAALNPLKNNIYLARSLLPHACVLNDKGKIQIAYPYAASLLTRLCLTDNPPLLTEDAKIVAAIVLDHGIRSYDNFQNVPKLYYWEKNFEEALLNRIVDHSPVMRGLTQKCWLIILKSALRRIESLLISKETKPATESFLKSFILCIIKHEEVSDLPDILKLLQQVLNHKNLGEVILSALINDLKLRKGINSGKVTNVYCLISLLSECSNLDEKGQDFLYKVWKKHVAYFSINQQTVFPVQHVHIGQKIKAYIAKNPSHFKLHISPILENPVLLQELIAQITEDQGISLVSNAPNSHEESYTLLLEMYIIKFLDKPAEIKDICNILYEKYKIASYLLPQACTLAKKGGIKLCLPYAATILACVCLSSSFPLSEHLIKLCAHILLDKKIKFPTKIPNLSLIIHFDHQQQLSIEMLRIIKSQGIPNPMPTLYWDIILGQARVKIDLYLKNKPQQGSDEEKQFYDFLKVFLFVMYTQDSMRTSQEYNKTCGMLERLRLPLSIPSELIKDPELIDEIKTHKPYRGVIKLVQLLSHSPKNSLNEEEQKNAYKVWKIVLSDPSLSRHLVFPYHHKIWGSKIIALLAKTPYQAFLFRDLLTQFLVPYLNNFHKDVFTDHLAKIIQQTLSPIVRELFVPLARFFPDKIEELIGRKVEGKEKDWLHVSQYRVTLIDFQEVRPFIVSPPPPSKGAYTAIDISCLCSLFNQLNFVEKSKQDFIDPNKLVVDKKVVAVEKFKEYLKALVHNVTHYEPIAAAPADPVMRKAFYDEVHNYLKLIAFLLLQDEPFENHSCLIELGQIGALCATPYNDISALYHALVQTRNILTVPYWWDIPQGSIKEQRVLTIECLSHFLPDHIGSAIMEKLKNLPPESPIQKFTELQNALSFAWLIPWLKRLDFSNPNDEGYIGPAAAQAHLGGTSSETVFQRFKDFIGVEISKVLSGQNTTCGYKLKTIAVNLQRVDFAPTKQTLLKLMCLPAQANLEKEMDLLVEEVDKLTSLRKPQNLRDKVMLMFHDARWKFVKESLARVPLIYSQDIHNEKTIKSRLSKHLGIYESVGIQNTYRDNFAKIDCNDVVQQIYNQFWLTWNSACMVEIFQDMLGKPGGIEFGECKDWFKTYPDIKEEWVEDGEWGYKLSAASAADLLKSMGLLKKDRTT